MAPHPDDAELGVGGALQAAVRAGVEVRIVVLSRGERGGLPGEREREQANAACRLGTTVIQHALPDGDIPPRGAYDAIEAAIESHNPEVVFAPSPEDTHGDHRVVAAAAVSVCRRVPRVFFYQTPSTTHDFRPTVFLPIDEYLEAKLAALKCFRSQEARVGLLPWARRTAAARGLELPGRGLAEAFQPYRLVLEPRAWLTLPAGTGRATVGTRWDLPEARP